MGAKPTVSVIICAHNEEDYVDKSLLAVTSALRGFSYKIILVADRCTDNTVKKAEKYDVEIIEKKSKQWKSSYSESLRIGYTHADSRYISIVDADIVVPEGFFKDLLPLVNGKTVSVAALITTYPSTLLNRVMYAWEKTREIAPLGKEPRGAARIMLKDAVDKIGGFKDVLAPDTDLDIRFTKRGYRSVASPKVKVYHIRHVTLGKTIAGQINSGRARYALHLDLARTVAHAVFRLRPFIILGWTLEREKHSHKANHV